MSPKQFGNLFQKVIFLPACHPRTKGQRKLYTYRGKKRMKVIVSQRVWISWCWGREMQACKCKKRVSRHLWKQGLLGKSIVTKLCRYWENYFVNWMNKGLTISIWEALEGPIANHLSPFPVLKFPFQHNHSFILPFTERVVFWGLLVAQVLLSILRTPSWLWHNPFHHGAVILGSLSSLSFCHSSHSSQTLIWTATKRCDVFLGTIHWELWKWR